MPSREVRDYGFEKRYVLEWKAPEEGPFVQVLCPECGEEMGSIELHGKCELVCQRCQGCYEVIGNGTIRPEVRFLKRVVLFDDEGRNPTMPSLGSALRGEDHGQPAFCLPVRQVLISFAIAILLAAAASLAIWLSMK